MFEEDHYKIAKNSQVCKFYYGASIGFGSWSWMLSVCGFFALLFYIKGYSLLCFRCFRLFKFSPLHWTFWNNSFSSHT